MSKQRPGVDAAIKLYKHNNSDIWNDYLNKYEIAIERVSINKKKPELTQLDKWLWNDLKNNVYDRNKKKLLNGYYLTKKELLDIMKWKLIRGQFRPLLKLVDSNPTKLVILHTSKALNILCYLDDKDNWKNALKELTTLKGIGVATASIILALFNPNLCPFMSDEVIESVYDGKRDYTIGVYTSIQLKLINKMHIMNANSDIVWNAEMIGKALWTSAILN